MKEENQPFLASTVAFFIKLDGIWVISNLVAVWECAVDVPKCHNENLALALGADPCL